MKELCDSCYYVEFCEKDKARVRDGICQYFYDNAGEFIEEEIVEDGRDEYRSAWFEYIADFE